MHGLIIICTFCFFFTFGFWMLTIPDLQKELRHRKVIKRATYNFTNHNSDFLVHKTVLSNIPIINKFLDKLPILKKFSMFIQEANVGINAFTLILICTVVYFLCYTVVYKIHLTPFLCFLIPLGFAVIPLLLVQIKVKIRRRKFEENFVDGITIIKNAIQAGQGLTSALNIVSQDAPWPIDIEFQKLLSEVEYGFSFDHALERLERRIPLEELAFFVSTIKIQRQSGGNLSQIIENIEETIRTRFELKREIRTLTAQGKLSGMILVAMPFFLLVAFSIINPGFLYPLLVDPLGQKALILSVVAGFLGIFWIWKIVNIKLT